MQHTVAKKIHVNNEGQEHIDEVDNNALRVGDRVLVNTGDKIPMDGTIYWGSGLCERIHDHRRKRASVAE